VLELLARGLTNKEIADALVITTNNRQAPPEGHLPQAGGPHPLAAAARAIGAGVQTDQVE